MGLFGRAGGFWGGILLSDGKEQTRNVPTRSLPLPQRLRVPLAQYREPAARPCVTHGDRVKAGQVIATAADDGSVAAHAPADATVSAIVRVDTPYRERVPAIELHPDGPSPPKPGPVGKQRGPCNLQQLLTTAARAGVYLPEPLSPTDAKGLQWLIVNGLESELVQTVARRTLIEQGDQVIVAAAWLKQVLGARRARIVVDRRWRSLLAGLRRACRSYPVAVMGLPGKYPGSSTPLLAKRVTGREVPYRGSAGEVGVCVVDVCVLLHLHRALETGVPHTHVLVAVAGDAVERPGCCRLPVGTSVAYVADHVGLPASRVRAVVDNLLAGPPVRHPEIVLTKRTRALLFFRDAEQPGRPPMGCIRCGLCQDHCPVNLDPRAFLDLVERCRLADVARHAPAACLECGLCDYVCPSALPLMRAALRSRSYVLAG